MRAQPRWIVPLVLVALVAVTALVFLSRDSTPETTSQRPPVEQVAQPHGGVVVMGVGDIAQDGSDEVNAAATGDLIRAAHPDAVITLGDNAYDDGTASDYADKYDPTWGSFKDETHPVPGNHDYHDSGTYPDGYVGYFGQQRVSNSTDGGLYYAWDVGDGWRAYAVNTEIGTSGEQLTWLEKDVAAHAGMHYILYTHHPRYTSGVVHDPDTTVCPLWDALAATGGLEIVLAGHQHDYERFAKMDCSGNAEPSGARSFVVGSGGHQLYEFGDPEPGSEFRNATDYGVLRLVLHRGSYSWDFIASGRGWDGSSSIDTHDAAGVLDHGVQAVKSPSDGG